MGMRPDDVAPMIAVIGLLASGAFIVWVIATGWRRHQIMKAQTGLQHKLLEKFGSAQELANYLNSEAGQKFLASATIEQTKPHGRILGGMTAGIVILMVGLSFIFLETAFLQVDADAARAFKAFGAIFSFLGLGFLFSTIAAYMLSKSWGLFNGKSEHSDHE
jgi:hypothetical protein